MDNDVPQDSLLKGPSDVSYLRTKNETYAECRYMNVFISGANGFFEHIKY